MKALAERSSFRPISRPAAWRLLALLVLAGLSAGCSSRPDRDLPAGRFVLARHEPLEKVLERLERMAETPLAAWAAQSRQDLAEGCPLVLSASSEEPAAPASFDCVAESDVPAGLLRLLGEADLAFVLPAVEGHRLVGTGRLSAEGDVQLQARLSSDAGSGPLGLLLPAADPAGPPRLNTREALFHSRVRTDQGIDFSQWIPEDAQADRMFQLRSQLFSSLVLDGVWEAAVYAPPEGRAMPDVALTLGYKNRDRAVAAVEEFLESLAERWPIRRSGFTWGELEGECLSNVRILPELAPCWTAHQQALFLSWNSESLKRALEGQEAAAAEPGAASDSGVFVYLDRFPAADRSLARTLAPEAEPRPPVEPPWRLLTLTGRRQGDLYEIEARLTGDPRS